MKNVEELTITELYQMVNDFHALMWMGNGCEVCAHCITVHKEPYYKTKCALKDECNPLWRGFEQSEEESHNCAKQDADFANEAATALYGVLPKWIPVTERLPIGGDDSGALCENVCLLMDDGTVSCGWMNGITKKVYYLNAIDDVIIKAPITRVTHWMPLPKPPKEEKHD